MPEQCVLRDAVKWVSLLFDAATFVRIWQEVPYDAFDPDYVEDFDREERSYFDSLSHIAAMLAHFAE